MIEADLVARLKADTGVVALVDARIYPAPAPEVATLPNVTWQVIAETPTRVADGVLNIRDVLFQVNAWAETALAATTLANAVRAALDDWESDAVQMSVVTNVTGLFDSDFAPPRWGRALDVQIVHKEA